MQPPLHIVAVMAIVRNNDEEILLIRSPRRGWESPGGQIENGEDLLTALKREVLEESGITIEPRKLIAIYSNVKSDPTKVMFTFSAEYVSGELTTSEESIEVGWFPIDQALEMVTNPAQKQKLIDAISESDQIIYRVYQTQPFQIFRTFVNN